MIHRHDVQQGSDEWLQLRCGRLTCSQMGIAAGNGVTREKLKMEKAGEIITGRPERVRFVSAAMEEGTRREEEARNEYAWLIGVDVAITGFIVNDSFPCLGYSPDGLLPDGGVLEIKCPLMATHIGYLATGGGVPSAYRHQVTGGMLIADAPYCDFVSYYPGLPLYVYRQVRDEKTERALLEHCNKFMSEVHAMVEWLGRYVP